MSKREQVANIHTNFSPKYMHTSSNLVYPNKYAWISQVQHITVNQNKHSRTCMSSKEWKFINLRRWVVAATTCSSIHKAATIATSCIRIQNVSIIIATTCIIHIGTKSTIVNPAQQFFWAFPSNGFPLLPCINKWRLNQYKLFLHYYS